jgi:hypothetical protein
LTIVWRKWLFTSEERKLNQEGGKMTTEAKLIQRKLSLLELAEFLKNVSEACRIHGCSRQHFYDIKQSYESQGIEGLKERTRRKPCIKNRVAPEVEEEVVRVAFEYLCTRIRLMVSLEHPTSYAGGVFWYHLEGYGRSGYVMIWRRLKRGLGRWRRRPPRRV